VDFTDLYGFWGGIWPARGGGGEKMRKNVRKKTKYARKCARKYLAGAKKGKYIFTLTGIQDVWRRQSLGSDAKGLAG
jgi:hypothetical protein